MNYSTRSLRAGIAIGVLVVLGLIGADALGQFRAGAEYNYDALAVISIVGLSAVVVLFGWNVVQYAIKRNK
jgi:hypothetical protein